MPVRQLSDELPSGSTAPFTISLGPTDDYFVYLGPLTTFYTPSTSCYQTTTSVQTGFKAFDYQLDTTLRCWPSISGSIQITTSEDWAGYYSPGICPSGWSAATTRGTNFFGTRSGTAVLCCPTYETLPFLSVSSIARDPN